MIIGKMHKLIEKSKKNQLSSRIIMILIVSMCAITGVLIFSYSMVARYNQTQYDQWCQQEFSEIKNDFLLKCYNAQGNMLACSYDQNVQRVFGEDDLEAYEIFLPLETMRDKIYKVMHSYTKSNRDIYNIYLVDQAGRYYKYMYYNDDRELCCFMEENLESQEEVISSIFHLGDKPCFAILSPIYSSQSEWITGESSNKIIGHSAVVLEAKFLQKKINEFGNKDGYACLLDADGNILMNSEKEIKDLGVLAEVKKPVRTDEMVSLKKNGYFINKYKINNNGWTFVVASKNINRDFYQKELFFYLSIGWILIVILIISISYRLLQNINSFVYKLIFHMECVGKGNLKRKIAYDEIEEFRRIEQGLNVMMEQVVGLSEQNIELSTQMYKQQKEQLQATLLALQSQMNPHFLYNTMECIKNIGVCYGIQEIEIISGAMGDIFRYSLSEEGIVTVAEEVECIKNYMAIQSIRFEGRYKIFFDIDPSLLDMKIMRLSLEPLVENSVKHGFAEKINDCKVYVRIYQQNQNVYMEIEDNGIGMSQVQIDKIYNSDTNEKESVALKNLVRRLKIFYKNAVDLRIESEMDMGTKICICITRK